MNATIWLRVRLDVNMPMETSAPTSRKVPTYCATAAPLSMSPAVAMATGIPTVSRTPTPTKATPERNFATTTLSTRIGCVNSNSSVPSRCSSANSLIVAAATNTPSRSRCRKSPSGLSDASSAVIAERK